MMGGSFFHNQPGNLTPPGSGGVLASPPGGYKPQPSGFRMLHPISANCPVSLVPLTLEGAWGAFFFLGIPGPSPRASSDWDSGCACGEVSGHSPRGHGDQAEKGGLVGPAPYSSLSPGAVCARTKPFLGTGSWRGPSKAPVAGRRRWESAVSWAQRSAQLAVRGAGRGRREAGSVGTEPALTTAGRWPDRRYRAGRSRLRAAGGAGSPHKQASETNILLTLRGWVRFQVQERVLVTELRRGARRQRAPERALRPKAPLDRGLSRPRGHHRGVPKSQEDPQTVRSGEEGVPGMNSPSPTHMEVFPALRTCLSPPSFPTLPPQGRGQRSRPGQGTPAYP